MTLDHLLNPGHLLQGVDVLGVVPQQLPRALHRPDELVAGRGLELARINLSGKFEERARIFSEIRKCLTIIPG